MIYLLVTLIAFAAVIFFLGRYLDVKKPGSKKNEIIMNLLYTILFVAILIPCGIIAVASMNPIVIAITFGINIILGVWLGIFLKKLQETLE